MKDKSYYTDLLYTQEDIDEYIRTNEELQESLIDLREEIKETRNEVAKKIFKKLKHELEKEKFFTIEQSAFDNAIEHAMIIVDEIAKKYGV